MSEEPSGRTSKPIVTDYGEPPDLTEHMPQFETTPDQDKIMKQWQEEQKIRKENVDDVGDIASAHDKIDVMLTETGNRLTVAQKKIGKYTMDSSSKKTSQISINIESEPTEQHGKTVHRRKSLLPSMLTKTKAIVSHDVTTTGVQTIIQGLDLDVIKHTADELSMCQEAQEVMVNYFEQVKERWVMVAAQTKKLQGDYSRVAAESCRICAHYQEELHCISGQVAALQSQLDHSQREKDVIRNQLTDSMKTQGRLRLEAEAAISREEATLNKTAFMEEEITYMKSEVDEAREMSRVLRMEYRKLEADREKLSAQFVESRLKQTQVVATYLDELQEREEERRELIKMSDVGSEIDVIRNTERQAKLTDERNKYAEEVELLQAKCVAQDVHIEELQRQLADMAKVVDAYGNINSRASGMELQRNASGVQPSDSKALTGHHSATGTGTGAKHRSKSKDGKKSKNKNKDKSRKDKSKDKDHKDHKDKKSDDYAGMKGFLKSLT